MQKLNFEQLLTKCNLWSTLNTCTNGKTSERSSTETNSNFLPPAQVTLNNNIDAINDINNENSTNNNNKNLNQISIKNIKDKPISNIISHYDYWYPTLDTNATEVLDIVFIHCSRTVQQLDFINTYILKSENYCSTYVSF